MITKIVEYVNVSLRLRVVRENEKSSSVTHSFIYSEVSGLLDTLVDMPGDISLISVEVEINQDKYDSESQEEEEEDKDENEE